MSDRLHTLSARMEEQLRQFATEEEESRRLPGAARVGMAGAAAAGGVYGGTRLRNAVINRAGVVDDYGNMVGRKGMFRDAAKGVARDGVGKAKAVARQGIRTAASGAGQAANSLYRQATKAGVPYSQSKGVEGAVRRAKGKASSVLGKTSKKLRGVARAFDREQIDRVVHLAAVIERLDFEEKQRSALGVASVGGATALMHRKKFKDSGLVYRKRDAAADGAKGGLAGGAAAVGAVGGAAGLAALAAKRKLPKGMLRKAGVKVGQFGKKAMRNPATGDKAIAGLIGGSALVGAGVQNASAKKRYKERMRQRLAGGEG